MQELNNVLAHDYSAIEDAAEQTDTTIQELLHEIKAIKDNKTIPITQRSHHVYIWLLDRIEAMSDYLDEIDCESSECGACHGSGGISGAHCYACGGSGYRRSSDAAAEAEYRADQTQDEAWLEKAA